MATPSPTPSSTSATIAIPYAEDVIQFGGSRQGALASLFEEIAMGSRPTPAPTPSVLAPIESSTSLGSYQSSILDLPPYEAMFGPFLKYSPLADKVLDTFVSHLSCGVCAELMWSPYTLSCGHTFCGPCLFKHFEFEIAGKMARVVGHGPCRDHRRGDCQIIPASAAERQALKRALRAHHLPPGDFLVFSCPLCRHELGGPHRPRSNYAIQGLVRGIWREHRHQVMARKGVRGASGSIELFDGLFR
ncbi:hypothetical protein FA13DRAFT_948127 [Coprinellus micaceus]|uniref:RING-type domain-containing protein n=1 Tax=Coprinellus micaceus TaxID=71717 RepID=A0A4Y7SZN9_COPMI|nr:hypothetical protein FA13DRAFT_948127 [Coprinellus micaceus]